MSNYVKPLPGDFVGVAVHAENATYLQSTTAADILVRDPQTTMLVAAVHVGRKTSVYTAGAAPTANLDAFTVRLRELQRAGKVLVVLETLPTALLLQEKLGIKFKQTFPATAWLAHRQYPTTRDVARALAGAELARSGGAGHPSHAALARARGCAQEAADAVALATSALADDSFTPLEWSIVTSHTHNTLRGIHLDGDRAAALLADARAQAAAAATDLAQFGFDARSAQNSAAIVNFIRTRFGADVNSASRKDVGLVLAARGDADLAGFRAALERFRHATADMRDLAKIGPGLRRVHGALRYGRARTGRLAGGGMDAVLNLHGMRKATPQSPARLRMVVVPPPNQAIAAGAVATPACEFVSLDLKSIEPRVHAFLADQQDLLQRFRAGVDVYRDFAQQIGPDVPRKVGKEAVLGLGYGMGVRKFQERLILGACDVDFDIAGKAHATYAQVFPQMADLPDVYWTALVAASNGATTIAGKCTFRPATLHSRDASPGVAVELPTGRSLFYWLFEASTEVPGAGTYANLARDDRIVESTRVELYPGTLLENVVQAVARDILMAQVLELEAAGYEVQLTIHDEAIIVWRPHPLGRSRDHLVARATAIMSEVPDSLPLLKALPVEPEVNTSVRRSLGD